MSFPSLVIYCVLLLYPQTAGGLEEVFFKNLDDLILHYKRRNQGLAMHLRHSVKRKTALLIQPQKPPEEPQRSPTPMSAPSAPEEHEEHDYESTLCGSSSCRLLTASSLIGGELYLTLFSIFLPDAPDLSEYVEVLPP